MRRFVLVAALLACAPAKFAKIDLASLPGADVWPDADAVVLLDHETIDYVNEGGATVALVTVHQTLRILRDAGRSVADIGFFYDGSFEEVTFFEARATYPDGRETRIEKKDATDTVEDASWVSFSDNRLLRAELPALPLGSVVEYVAVTRQKNPERFPYVFDFESRHPMMKSELVVRWPSELDVAFDSWRRGAPQSWKPAMSQDGDVRVATFTRENVRALPREEHAPARSFWAENVGVRLLRHREGGVVVDAPSDDASLSRWMWRLLEKNMSGDATLQALHDEILRDAPPDKIERARRLYRWTQEKVQYCAVEIGEGGWVPHTPPRVADVRYGDCKDKATLLRSLLSYDGVSARVASVHHHDGLARPFRFPAMGANFNHMILLATIDGREIALDPTSRTVPFGRLPAGDQGAVALPIVAEGAHLVQLPQSRPDENAIESTFDLALDDDGAAVGTGHWSVTGWPADELRYRLLVADPDEVDDVAAAWIDLRGSEGVVQNARFVAREYDGVDRPLVVDADVRRTGAAHGPVDLRVIVARELLGTYHLAVPEGPREAPLLWRGPLRAHAVARIRLPSGTMVPDLPAPVEIERRWGKLSLTWEVIDGELTLKRTIEWRTSSIPAAEVEGLRAFTEEIDAALSRPVVIRGDAR